MQIPIDSLRRFLEDLITPDTDSEKELFKENNLIDDYIEMINRIPAMTESELINEINHQLSPYNLKL